MSDEKLLSEEILEDTAQDRAEADVEAAVAAEPAESMDDYKEELEKSFQKVSEGDILTGTVIGVTETEVAVDLKYYAQGIIAKENYSSDPDCILKDKVQVGDSITATVIKTDDGEGNIVLSSKEANDTLLWEKFENMLNERTVFPVKINGIVNKGVVANVEGVRAFIPASKLDAGYVENTEDWLGRTIDVMVITADPEKKRLVLSGREVARQKRQEDKNAKIAKCQVGAVLEGTVDSIQPYGAFINLDNGLSGLVHISQISMKRIKTPSEVLTVGDKVKVKVISNANNKISLSIKALQDVAEKEAAEEVFDYKEDGKAATSLGALLAGFKVE